MPPYICVLSVFILILAFRCYQGLGSMASELRMKLMISMKEEEDSTRQKEETNIVLQVLHTFKIEAYLLYHVQKNM